MLEEPPNSLTNPNPSATIALGVQKIGRGGKQGPVDGNASANSSPDAFDFLMPFPESTRKGINKSVSKSAGETVIGK